MPTRSTCSGRIAEPEILHRRGYSPPRWPASIRRCRRYRSSFLRLLCRCRRNWRRLWRLGKCRGGGAPPASAAGPGPGFFAGRSFVLVRVAFSHAHGMAGAHSRATVRAAGFSTMASQARQPRPSDNRSEACESVLRRAPQRPRTLVSLSVEKHRASPRVCGGRRLCYK